MSGFLSPRTTNPAKTFMSTAISFPQRSGSELPTGKRSFRKVPKAINSLSLGRSRAYMTQTIEDVSSPDAEMIPTNKK